MSANGHIADSKRLIPVIAAAVFMLAGGMAVMVSGVPQPQTDEVLHRFTLDAPDARSVAVVGNFNRWDPLAHPLAERDGLWQITVPLKKGSTYFYNFLIDGEKWITDPAQLATSEDSFGKKSVLELDANKEVRP